MKIKKGLFGLSLIVALVAGGGCASSQQKLTLDEVLDNYPEVASLDAAVKNSKENGAELLAPEGYAKALESWKSAMNAAHNQKTDAANKAANEGLKVIDKLDRDSESSKQLLAEVLSTRERAMAAGIANLQSEKLEELDGDLKKTATLIEEGNIEKAKQRRPKLIEGYAKLELTALKQSTADQAKSAIASAKQQGAEKYAPKTIALAEEKMAIAVSILDADRTQTDKADVQAKKAKWLAEQSAAITETVKDFDRRDYTSEDIVLWHQSQLSTVNEPLGGQLPFNEPGDNAVISLRNTVAQLKSAEDKYGKQLALTEKERLALEEKDRADKQKFETVQAMFAAKEANVYRQRQNVLISAHGFQFPSGVSEIQAGNFPLMNKIIRAIKIFPGSRIEISGHTDSTGADNVNQSLSKARAEKVGKFLSEVGEISSSRIKTTGFGESRPVASNKTAAGRAENRRVEIMIVNE
ncbi:MAG: OmpA family protein [Gammaproteobacteria bacterium]|jgi:outer membrane protein OmpA-like peptidoglycan-associated protein|nr:OmpA family protein [Gammaproteobacteria bacterium]MCW8941656.1 OmpA family protein [Gammaproteobacteria bacterium]